MSRPMFPTVAAWYSLYTSTQKTGIGILILECLYRQTVQVALKVATVRFPLSSRDTLFLRL